MLLARRPTPPALVALLALALGLSSCVPVPIKITSISPSRGATAGGFTVTIAGEGFVSGTKASIGGAPLDAIQVAADGKTLEGTAPAGAAGRADVTVETPGGQRATLAQGFTYEAPAAPAVTTYDLKLNVPLGGALAGSGITGLAYAIDSEQLIVADSGGRLTAFDFASPYTTITQIRYFNSSVQTSHPYGLAFAGTSRSLLVLDYNSQGPGRARLVKVDRGADGLYGTSDDTRVSASALPTFLDGASGIAYRTKNGELFFCSYSGSTTREVIVTDPQATTERRRFTLPSSLGMPTDAGFVADRLVVVGTGGGLAVLDPDTGALAQAAQDPVAALPGRFSFGTLGLSRLDGVTAAFYTLSGVPKYAETPFFIASGDSGSERVLVFVGR